MNRIILDLCGGTGAWSAPYKEAGYDVRIITLPEQDVRDYITPRVAVHGILAAPPCDHFCISGSQYWKEKDADGRTDDGLTIVDACLRIIRETRPDFWVLENPLGRLRSLRRNEMGPPTMAFDPCDYGDPYTKRTLLWGYFVPPIKMHVVEPEKVCSQGSWLMKLGGKSANTKRLRSITPPGFARAFFEANP